MNLYEKLSAIQVELKANKNLYNKHGNYYYRNVEGIFEGLKPLLGTHKLYVTVTDDIVEILNEAYIKATATISDGKDSISTYSYAKIDYDAKMNMSGSQRCGSASSYARKYALNGLFCIDDTKDDDEITANMKEEEYKEYSKKAVEPKKTVSEKKVYFNAKDYEKLINSVDSIKAKFSDASQLIDYLSDKYILTVQYKDSIKALYD